MSTESSKSKLEAYIRLQDENKEIITKGKVNFHKSPKERITVPYCETRLESLEKIWLSFSTLHNQIISEIDKSDYIKSCYYKNNIHEVTEELYYDYKTELRESIESMKLKSCENSNKLDNKDNDNYKVNSVRLPKISIPVFSGNYSEWPSFRDLFLSCIHKNEQLDDVQKLHYLKGHLTKEAEQLLRHIPITSGNYNVCWDLLESRYDNKKYLCNQILDKLMGQRALTAESTIAIKGLLDNMNECLNALVNIGISIATWDIIVIYIISHKLDPITRKEWEAKATESDDLSTLNEFREFLNHKFRSLEFLDKAKSKIIASNKSVVHVVNEHGNHYNNKTTTCLYCKDNHRLSKCKTFQNESYETRHNFVQTKGLCFNCLGTNHSVYACRQPVRCSVCKRKHNVLLHPDSNISTERMSSVAKNVVVTNANISPDINEPVEVITCFSSVRSQVLLATALVNIQAKTGVDVSLRCLLDQGSQASFITESAVQRLGLKKVPTRISVSGVGGEDKSLINSKSVVFIKLRSIHDPTFVLEAKVHVLNKLTTLLPSKKVVFQMWSKLRNMNLADPRFDVPNKVDLLLGAEVYGQILMEGVLRGPPGTPVAQKTKLGWILSGLIHSKSSEYNDLETVPAVVAYNALVQDDCILKKFWELEAELSTTSCKKLLTEEEQMCENIFQKTTIRDEEGRYVVKLPFRTDDPSCKYGNLKDIASKCLYRLEQRLSKNPELMKQYSEVMREYLDLKHMEVIPINQLDKSDTVYLPHHAVVRNDKTTTKVRVVYNASQKGINGVSLNDDLLVGPKLQHDLRHILMRWRRYPICLSADIVKMYRQVKIAAEDTDYLRVLWRDNESRLRHYRMLRVTFGTSSAPYLAVRALQQLAHDEGHDYPAASERVLRDFYVDDLLTGCETADEALKIYQEIKTLLNKGGFELQKWVTNSMEVLDSIGEGSTNNEKGVKIGTDKDVADSRKVLGLNWKNIIDCFEYSVKLPEMEIPVTKRRVISDISRLFDPLGWMAPVIITSKIFIQKLWLSGIEWDQELPSNLLSEWTAFRSELPKLTGHNISRWIQKREDRNIDLQGFCDASNDAYGAVVYARVIDLHGNVYVHLIAAKTRVAPVRQVSIPRLELCGALLLAKLLTEVAEVMEVPKDHVHAWTDSTIVLAWLSSHPGRWKTFVANRVSEIVTLFSRKHWSHVRSGENPADLASRGMQPADLINSSLWKHGPIWLRQEKLSYVPEGEINIDIYDTKIEEKTKKLCCVTTFPGEENEIFTKFSSLRKQVRVIAWCRRFYKRTHFKFKSDFPLWLTCDELQEALKLSIIRCQNNFFCDEIECLEKGRTISNKSKLLSFTPFVDSDGILRVGGRLQNSEMSEVQKHPILIPRSSHLAKLIVADAHIKTLHGGPQLMINYIRSKYWIVDLKGLVKGFVHKCVVCVRYAARSKHPIMGQLPAARVTPSRPFSHSGVDYAGPISVRTTKGRGHRSTKGYLCLFICMATKAIHLEAVSDMTSDGFVAAFKRFVARRGHCSNLWSDNGSNFVGAERELKSLLADEKSTVSVDIREWLALNGTVFHRIPPYSPNFGGLWEAGIKATKQHLKRVIGTTTLTFEELTTVLCQIEACLNSRPITQVSTSDVEDPYPLTPGHFLVGEPLLLLPDSNYKNSNITYLKRWQLTQRMVQQFWQRWSKEYLTRFLQRYRWQKLVPEPNLGDLVLVMEEDLPPARWLFGIIVEKHPGLDQVTRVVSLRCKGSVIKRPVSKICILPIQNDH